MMSADSSILNNYENDETVEMTVDSAMFEQAWSRLQNPITVTDVSYQFLVACTPITDTRLDTVKSIAAQLNITELENSKSRCTDTNGLRHTMELFILSVWAMDIAMDNNRTDGRRVAKGLPAWIEDHTMHRNKNSVFLVGAAALSYTYSLCDDHFQHCGDLFTKIDRSDPSVRNIRSRVLDGGMFCVQNLHAYRDLCSATDMYISNAFLCDPSFIHPYALMRKWVDRYTGREHDMFLYLLYALAVSGCLAGTRVYRHNNRMINEEDSILRWVEGLIRMGITTDNCSMMLRACMNDVSVQIIAVFTYIRATGSRFASDEWGAPFIRQPVSTEDAAYRLPTLESMVTMILGPELVSQPRVAYHRDAIPATVKR